MSRQEASAKSGYHHGDLRRSLMDAALELIRELGIEALSLRKLAERVGVSQTALYHHFKDKQELLCALGEEGVQRMKDQAIAVLSAPEQSLDQKMEAFVKFYVRFAIENPELYELMFGRTTWKQPSPRPFHQRARQSFRSYGELVAGLQASGALPADIDPLRMAQVAWATLHGLCRMYNDGLAFSRDDVEDISLYALSIMRKAVGMPAS